MNLLDLLNPPAPTDTEALIGLMRANRQALGTGTGPDPFSQDELDSLMPRAAARRDLADRNIANLNALVGDPTGPETFTENGVTQRKLYSQMDPQRKAAALGLDANAQPYRRMPMPEASPAGDPTLEDMLARLDQQKQSGKFTGGLTVMRPVQKNRATGDQLALNRESYQERQSAKKNQIADNRKQFVANRQKAMSDPQGGQLLNMLMASVGPEERAKIAVAMIGQQGALAQTAMQTAADEKTKTADATRQKLLMDRAMANAMLQSDDPNVMRQGLLLAQSLAGGGEGMASVPAGTTAPTIEDIANRVKTQRAITGADPEATLTPEELLDQFTIDQAKGMTAADVQQRGLTQEVLRGMIAGLEDQAQRKTGLGRMFSGPGSTVTLPFGWGTRSPEEVSQAARRLQTANALLNAFLAGR